MAVGIDMGGHDRPMAEINVTPLVDVMLVLLVIFIVTAPLLAQALRVDLPRTEAAPSGEPDTLTVAVASDGALSIDSVAVDRDGLVEGVRSRLAERPEMVVRLAADGVAPYQSVADVIALLKKGGARRLAFATQAP